mgnify:CR=1 FL=1
MNQVRRNAAYVGLMLFGFSSFMPLCSGDLEVTNIKVTYLDDRTDPDAPTTRVLKAFKDYPFWSKPGEVDIEITLRNVGSEKLRADILAELYFLLSSRERDYPPIKDDHPELRTLTSDPVWVWNKTFQKQEGPKLLSPGGEVTMMLRDCDIEIGTSSSLYGVVAVGFRGFGNVYPRSKDRNLANNVIDYVVRYGD